MSRYVFKLPDVGEGTAEAEISQWHVKAGDRIEEDQPLVDVTTDKTIVEIPAPASGIVLSIHGNVGEKVAVGSEIVVIETDAKADAPAEAKPAEMQREKADQAAGTSVGQAPPSNMGSQPSEVPPHRPRGHGSPAVRKRARELSVDLSAVHGSGPGGRVTHADLDAFLKEARRDVHDVTRRTATPEQEVIEEHRVVGIRRKIAERMQESKGRIPHYSYVEEVDVTALEKLRQHLNDRHSARRGRLTPLAFVMRALISALSRHPEINARFDDENGIVHRHAAVHIGIATQTPHGLVVPVVRNAQTRDLWDCAAEVDRLAGEARAGRATRSELSGSTITITSLGRLGGIASTPVINHPEVAIVGVNKIAERAVVRDKQIVVRQIMNFSSSFDHRVVDGWNAAEFIQDVRQLLEEPATLFLE